jgi:predicted amidohydrolase
MPKSNEIAGRRNFLGQFACGAGLAAWAAGTSAASAVEPAASLPDKPVPRQSRLPREVWIATVAQDGLRARDPRQMIERVLARMESVVAFEPDIICLPEEFPLANIDISRPRLADVAEKPIGEFSQPIAEFAKLHRCYVVCPIDTRDESGRFYNAAVLFDRQGQVVGEYRKMHPTISEMEYGITPGPVDPPVFHTDFGVIGIQICYDIEWPYDWRKLRSAGAEIVFWPSAFAGGSMVNTMAWLNKVCVVSSTNKDTSKICDISGAEVARTTRWNGTACAPVNLEKVFLHTWPGVQRFEAIQARYGRKVRLQTHAEEEWTILESLSPDVKVADILKEFGLSSREDAISLASAAQDTRRPAVGQR